MKKTTTAFIMALFCTAGTTSLIAAIPYNISYAAKTKKVTITFSKSTDTIENGKNFQFKAKVKNGKASKVVWKSSNAKIIKINKKTGMATAKKTGKATITAFIGKKLVRRTVTVSPSIQDLVNANDTYKNLKTGVFTSVYGVATSSAPDKDSNIVYNQYCCLDKEKNITLYQTVENSYFYYVTNGKKYKLDYANGTEVVSEDFLENENPNNTFMCYSNAELISAEMKPDNTYHLVYMADIGGMTETEQVSVGLDSGICVLDTIVEPKNLLVRSYKITNYSSSGSTTTTVNGTFVYNGENELTLPPEIQNALPLSSSAAIDSTDSIDNTDNTLDTIEN